MNFRCFEKKKRSITIYLTAILGIICVFAFTVDAQRPRRPLRPATSIISSTSPDIVQAPLAGSLTQCQDGATGAAVPCSGGNYSTGSLNRNNSHYVEGDSIPYQITLTAPANSTGNTVTLNWDTSRNGVHALDYLTTYDRTEGLSSSGRVNDPCTGTGADCSLVDQASSIPTDTNITAANPNVHQISGVFTMFGGTITNVSAYTLTGTYAGTSSTSVTLTFKMGPNAGIAILAVAAHASSRTDWGNGNASVNISGAPFHFDAGGNNGSVTVGALVAAATINVIKLVHNLNGTNSNPNAHFGFISNGGPLGNFTLTDSNPDATLGGEKSGTTGSVGTSFTVQEDLANMPLGYSFTQGSCTIDPAGFPNASTVNGSSTSPVQLGANTVATIVPGEGNTITCTYENGGGFTTAAKVTIGGRVTGSDGRGIAGAKVTIIDDHGQARAVSTNSFGYYTVDNVEVGRAYVVGASARGYSFTSKLMALTSALSNINFVAN